MECMALTRTESLRKSCFRELSEGQKQRVLLARALLVSALVVFPALSAMRVFKSFFAVTVAADIVAFGIFYLTGLIRSKET